MPRDLDHAALTGRPSLGSLLRAVRASNIWVYSMTVALFMFLAPMTVLVGLVPIYQSDPGFLVLMGAIAAMGAFTIGSVLWQVRGEAGLPAFARTNGLDLTQGMSAPHYAGRRFADGSLVVMRSLRTREPRFLEVGDTFSAKAPRRVTPPTGTQVQRFEAHLPEVFLRVGLAGPVRPDAEEADLLDAALDARLQEWAGAYTVEWADHELTLHGSRGLGAHDAGRVQEGFELAELLRDRADEVLVVDPADVAAPTPSGIPVPVLGRQDAPGGRRVRPLVVVGGTLAFLVVGPVVFALVMSLVEDQLSGRPVVAALVIGLGVAGGIAVVSRLVQAFTAPRSAEEEQPSAVAARSASS